MRKWALLILSLLIIVQFFSCVQPPAKYKEGHTFTAFADMRYYATEKYRTSKHFLGAVEAAKKVGAGSFMVSPGDTDPPAEVKEVISQVMGEDYPWYPSVGNHEIESEEYMNWLREYNKNGTTLPNVVRKGPPGCAETTFAFEWGDCHFVILNQYFDGKSDKGTDGDVIPELLHWLEQDLAENTKRFVFVFGHEPIVSVPDMDNGRIRHQGDSLDKYPVNAFNFYRVMMKYRVTAYVCGHTHSTSYANINGLWQFDVGHSRGIEENSAPDILFQELMENVTPDLQQGISEKEALIKFYASNKKQVDKTLFHARLTSGKSFESYKDIEDDIGQKGLYEFYYNYRTEGESRQRIEKVFWENAMYRKSSFMKFNVGNRLVKVDIFRDDGHGGDYQLRETVVLK